ncbi:MAG: adenylosuccinate synthase [Leptolinea sp.]|jgi:adenylosuccinate synthase|nr:adenylosuccinate synthase [Leptolinea sp.]
MPIHIAVGMQWGDEGKGRVVDLLSADAAIVCRYNGGDNAGHTVTVGKKTFKLHLIPSGIIHSHTIGILGGGMVINPLTLLDEMNALKLSGIELSPRRLYISPLAHLITPAHRLLDQAEDEARGKGAIGTTGRGIGPTYIDKAARRGLRAGEILEPESFRVKVKQHFKLVDRQLQSLFHKEPLDVESMTAEWVAAASKLAPYIQDATTLLHDAVRSGDTVLAEGAQGTLLDLDYGTYPFVTSSNTTATGIFSGLALGIMPVDRIIGITKAFQTRVGAGPFPTELSGELAARLRGTGANPWDEYGTTTGRPRRVGWLDMVLLRYAVMINGVNELCITKLDILSGLPEIHICTSYKLDGRECEILPMGLLPEQMNAARPVYETLPGWKENITAVRAWKDLPKSAQDYIRQLEMLSGVHVSMISVGPERDQVIRLD